MKNLEFMCWLNGYLLLSQEAILESKQLCMLQNHLNLVKAVDGYLNDTNEKLYQLLQCCIQQAQFNHKAIKHFVDQYYTSNLFEINKRELL